MTEAVLRSSKFKAYVINLDRDPQRLEVFQTYSRAAGLDVERIRGVLGAAVERNGEFDDYFFEGHEANVSDKCMSVMSPGTIGCYASHLRTIRRVADDDSSPGAIIFEDDASFDASLHDVIDELPSRLPADWDLVRLSNPPKRAFLAFAPLPGPAELVRFSKVPNGATAYIISRAGARKFLRPMLRTRAVDEDLRRPWLFSMNVFGVLPVPVDVHQMPSTIDSLGQRQSRGYFERRFKRPADPPAELVERLRFNIATLTFGDWTACAAANLWQLARRRFYKSARLEPPVRLARHVTSSTPASTDRQ
jgi:glycosyl transferase, family 25